jgi:hypothetical protein
VDLKRQPVRLALGLLGTIAVGAVGSGLWDIVAKPGLGWIVSSILAFAGFFSRTVSDLPYSSAALDATPLPSLLLLMLAALVAPSLYSGPMIRWYLKHHVDPRLEAAGGLEKIVTFRRILTGLTIGFTLFLTASGGLAFTVTNKAIAIRRTWEANLTLLAPHVSAERLLQLGAQFSAITSREEYRSFEGQANQIRTLSGITFRKETELLR